MNSLALVCLSLYLHVIRIFRIKRFWVFKLFPFLQKLMWKTGWQRQERWLVYFYATVELVHYTHYVDKGVLMAGVANTYRARICEPLRSPGIDSQLGEPVRQLYLSHRPARINRLAESIPRNRFLGSIKVYKYGLCICSTGQ